MIDNDMMVDLLAALPVKSYKSAVSKSQMKLTTEQSNALGEKKRNLVRFVKIAINAISDKLEVQSVIVDDTQSDTTVNQWLIANRFDNVERDIYKAIVRDGRTFVLVAYDGNKPILTQVDAYDGNTGAVTISNAINNSPLYTLNIWNQGTQRNIDVYYPDRIEKYFYDIDGSEWKKRSDYDGEPWPIDWTDKSNKPLGIALVEFDIGESDIVEAVQLQHDMNEALLDMLSTSRTMGWPQRVLKNASKETYLLNQYEQPLMLDMAGYPIPRKIELTPGSILMLQGADSDLVQLPAAEINTAVLDKLEALMTQVTTVPNHYFGGSDFPSGVALIQAESRLSHKVESHQGFITPSLETMITMMLKLSNTFANTGYVEDVQIEIIWYPPQVETEDLRMEKEKNRVTNATLLVNSGILAVEDALRYIFPDKDEKEIQAMAARSNAGNLTL